MVDKRKALGRGLGALIPSAAPAEGAARKDDDGVPAAELPETGRTARREYFLCPIEEIVPSQDNPRQKYDEQRLEDLAASIRAQGLVQPLVVRLRSPEEMRGRPDQSSFVLIAGERRWRAAQRAGLRDVPVVVKDVNAARAFELALVENLQREDLNAIEEAEAYRRLSDEFGYTQEELSRRVGRDRATVANSLRLLKLPEAVRDMVVREELSMGHARALLGLPREPLIEQVARKVVERQLSVRQTEDLVRRMRDGGDKEAAPPQRERSPAVRDLEERLQKSLGTRVRLKQKSAKAGRIEVEYHSLDQLDGLLKRFLGEEPA